MKRSAFTLAEVLVALLVAAIVIPVATRALMTVAQLDETAANRSRAAGLAELKLQELVVTGNWQDAESNGDFGDDYPGFTWEMHTDAWSADDISLTRLDVVVLGPARFGQTTVTLTTLVSAPEE